MFLRQRRGFWLVSLKNASVSECFAKTRGLLGPIFTLVTKKESVIICAHFHCFPGFTPGEESELVWFCVVLLLFQTALSCQLLLWKPAAAWQRHSVTWPWQFQWGNRTITELSKTMYCLWCVVRVETFRYTVLTLWWVVFLSWQTSARSFNCSFFFSKKTKQTTSLWEMFLF